MLLQRPLSATGWTVVGRTGSWSIIRVGKGLNLISFRSSTIPVKGVPEERICKQFPFKMKKEILYPGSHKHIHRLGDELDKRILLSLKLCPLEACLGAVCFLEFGSSGPLLTTFIVLLEKGYFWTGIYPETGPFPLATAFRDEYIIPAFVAIMMMNRGW